MHHLKFVLFLFMFIHAANAVLKLTPKNYVFDPKFYEDALDPELCEKQLDYLSYNDTLLRVRFLDAGIRIPKYIESMGNTYDFGSYNECLEIHEDIGDSVIDGKYCMIRMPLDQFNPFSREVADFINVYSNSTSSEIKDILLKSEMLRQSMHLEFDNPTQRDLGGFFNPEVILHVATCVPKTCTTKQALASLNGNINFNGNQNTDIFCRLPDDKIWAPADTVAITLLSVLGAITIISTTYDVYNTVILKKDSKIVGTLRRSFSIYTNTRRLLTFTSVPGSIECIDGIRAFAMAWVIFGHTITVIPGVTVVVNMIEAYKWSVTPQGLWLLAAPITVDTFFALSGLLVVYTTAGKITGLNFLKNLHFFYLQRLLRLFPLLAFAILLHVSVFNRITDGPYWSTVAYSVENCRVYWWSNLLHLQNYLNPLQQCLNHTWYITLDMQMHFICPIILVWVLTGNKKYAWCSLITGVVVSVTASTVYIFYKQFPSARPLDSIPNANYMQYYYRNTLTRAPSFFVGMLFGYIMYIYRKEKVHINKVLVIFIWLTAAAIGSLVIYSTQYANEHSGESTTIDSLINAFTRPAWAACVGWMIFACHHGYGGIINWLLSMNEIKLLSRISYGMYIVHFPIMIIHAGSSVAPYYFDLPEWCFIFIGHFAIAFVVGLIVTVLVDSPASILIKHFLVYKKPQPAKARNADPNEENKTETKNQMLA